jgi:hypothetical protein
MVVQCTQEDAGEVEETVEVAWEAEMAAAERQRQACPTTQSDP